jgi:hypothetical protein
MKKCNKCKIELVEGLNAYKNQYRCKPCTIEYRRVWDKTSTGKQSQQKWERLKQGVYQLISDNEVLYVGESSILNKRKHFHLSCIKNPDIAPKSHKTLYSKLSQYSHIIFSILEETPNHKEREQYWINELKPKYNGKEI